MKNIDSVLKTRSESLLRDFQERHTLHDVIEITSTKASHILLGTYEDRDGTWKARIQPAHLYDVRFRAGTFSLSVDQLDQLIESLEEIRDVLSDRPSNRVKVVQSKRSPAKQAAAAAATQAPAPVPAESAESQVLAAIGKLASGLEAMSRRLEALEASVPQVTEEQDEQEVQEEVKKAIEWQLWNNGPFDCPVCGKSYKSRGRYLTHLEQEHGIELDL